MKRISQAVVQAVGRELAGRGATPGERGYTLKWLRYYLDFCENHNVLKRDVDQWSGEYWSWSEFSLPLTTNEEKEAPEEAEAREVMVAQEWRPTTLLRYYSASH